MSSWRSEIEPVAPIVVPTNIRHPSQWTCCLLDFDVVEKKTTEELPNCLRTLPPTSGFMKPPRDTPSLNNKWLKNIIDDQIKKIGKKPAPCYWMRQAVFYPLGPQRLKRLEEFPFHLPQRFQYQQLVQNGNAYLAVSCVQSEEYTIQVIEEALGSSGIENDQIFVSTQNSVMNLKYGEKPKILSDASESTLLVVIDETPKNESAKEYYEFLVGCKIVKSQVLSYPEKQLIERKSGNYYLKHEPMLLLEFYSNEDRQRAKDLLNSVDVLFCGAMHRHTDIHESFNLYLAYEMNVKNDVGVAVTIKDKRDKERIITAFKWNRLKIDFYKNDQYDENARTFVLHNFPSHYRKTEQRLKLVNDIIEKNRMQIEKVEIYERRVHDAMNSFYAARSRNIVKSVENQLKWIKRYRINAPDEENIYAIRSRDDMPWAISRKKQNNTEHITVYFKETTLGREMVDAIVKETIWRPQFLAVDQKDTLGPQTTPYMRKSFSISRTIRSALDIKIHRLDQQIRTTFTTLAANADPIMEEDRALYYAARLFDEWDTESDTGLIGVMGWCPESLDQFIQKLRALLTPLTLEHTPELLSGAGEVYVRSLMTKYIGALVVEVDRFAECVQLIGDAAEEALEDLRKFKDQKEKFQMFTQIPVDFPHLNPGIKEEIDMKTWKNLRMAIGISYLRFDTRSRVIEFEGNVKAYEKLMEVLEQLSAEIFKRETGGREDPLCLTCWTKIDVFTDFFRFECGHVMCRQCANAKIRTMLTTKLVCEKEGCGKLIAPSEIISLILGGANRIKDFDTAKLVNLNRLILDEYMHEHNLSPCSTTDCVGIRSLSEEGVVETKHCADCSQPYCGGCKSNLHPGVSCEEHRNLLQPDFSIQVYITNVGARNVNRCPKCDMMVEKISGCNHMACTKCLTHFCWICRYYVEGGESGRPIYRHLMEVHGGYEDLGEVNPVQWQQAHNDAAIYRAVMEDLIREGLELMGRPMPRRNWLPPQNPWPPRNLTPPPPPRPARSIEYTVLPPALQNIVPRHDVDIYLEFINRPATLDEQNEHIRLLLNNN